MTAYKKHLTNELIDAIDTVCGACPYISECQITDERANQMGLDDDTEFRCVNQAWNRIFNSHVNYYVVEFLEKDGSIWSMAIKVKTGYTPTIEDIETFLKPDMEQFGYDHVHDFYEVDEDEVYAGYDTDNIDSWPILGI